MSTIRLLPCPSCARHLRASESACPFCGHRFGDEFQAAPRSVAPAGRLTRAAMFALGGGTAVLATACSSSSTTAPNVFPAYGGNPLDDATLVAPYGLAPMFDASDDDVVPCLAAGGECSDAACEFPIDESCGSGGGTCCVPCEADPNVVHITASNYDQTCTVDSDCVAIGVGDPCRACDILCPGNAAINRSSLSQYTQDVTSSPAFGDGAACSCAPTTLPVCCNAGTCDPSCGADGSTGPIQGLDASPGLDASDAVAPPITDAYLDDSPADE